MHSQKKEYRGRNKTSGGKGYHNCATRPFHKTLWRYMEWAWGDTGMGVRNRVQRGRFGAPWSNQLRPSAGRLRRSSFTAAAQPNSQEHGWHHLGFQLPDCHCLPMPQGRTQARICLSVLCGVRRVEATGMAARRRRNGHAALHQMGVWRSLLIRLRPMRKLATRPFHVAPQSFVEWACDAIAIAPSQRKLARFSFYLLFSIDYCLSS
jgi:hypothetical protein